MIETDLLVADYRAGTWRLVRLDDRTAPTLPPARVGVLAEHAGVVQLPAGGSGARAAFVDDLEGTVVVIGSGEQERRIPAAIPGEHLAVDPSGRVLVATTGAGASLKPWSDLVTVVDLEGQLTRRARVRVGEPGVVLTVDQASGAPVAVFRHREPGEVEAIDVADLLATGPHCPEVRGSRLPLDGQLGHGDAADHSTGVVYLATEAGIERFRVEAGRLERLPTWPWPADARAFFLRLDPQRRRLVASLRGGADEPRAWHRWQNTIATWSLDDGSVDLRPTRDGLVFRPDTRDGTVAWTVIHPDGDSLGWYDGTTCVEIELPPMTNAPRPGATPWDAVDGVPAQRRSLALLDSAHAAVTRGGDGELHLAGPGGIEDTIAWDSPLSEGGHLAALSREPARLVDGVGR